MDWKKLIIPQTATILQAMQQINEIGYEDGLLFVVNDKNQLIGTATDGDIRRGLLNAVQTNEAIEKIANKNFYKIVEGEKLTSNFIKDCVDRKLEVIPVISTTGAVINVKSFKQLLSHVPVQAVLMAGGRGARLLPLTKNTPKPLLKIGDKPIIEHNIDRLISFGVDKITLSINYLGNQLKEYFKNGELKDITINYVEESTPLGTLGSVSLIDDFDTEYVLVMNSDLLTNIDYAEFYHTCIAENADMAIATIPYHIDLPYAIMEIEGIGIKSFEEKPRYTYYANSGIYLIKKTYLLNIPKNEFYNATDLIEHLIAQKNKVINFPILGYWLDIGKKNDFEKAQEDIKHLNL
jgi:dTDP-glucose pyrophosphorylase